jgi:hypothetical protein
MKNYNCDGAQCADANGETRVYPLGSGANLILCQACFAHENRYRLRRGQAIKRPEEFPPVDWTAARRYPDTSDIPEATEQWFKKAKRIEP